MTFEKLKEIYEIDIEYEAKSALAIMAGREQAFTSTDQTVTMIGGKPVIPGSSLKGALRSTLEAILSQRGVEVCVPESVIPKDFSREKENYAEKIGRIPPCNPRVKCCAVCEVFGAADLASRTIVLDARPEGAGEPKIIDRNHVAIARDNKAAAGGKLLQMQAVDAGTKFTGIIRLVNPEPWHIGAVLVSLKSVELLGIGSKKSAGYGEIAVNVLSIKKKALDGSKWKETTIENREEFLTAFEGPVGKQ